MAASLFPDAWFHPEAPSRLNWDERHRLAAARPLLASGASPAPPTPPLPHPFVTNGDRLDIQASLDPEGLKKLRAKLKKYQGILR
jgi:hypothetical protein